MHTRVSKPPKYIKLTPILFSHWEEWASQYEDEQNEIIMRFEKNKKDGEIRPIGEKIAPDWVKYEFKNFEDFFQHYNKLLVIGN
jgi:hypothetical protein